MEIMQTTKKWLCVQQSEADTFETKDKNSKTYNSKST